MTKVLARLNANKAHLQIAIKEEEQEKVDYACHAEQFQIKQFPFAVTSIAATFQTVADAILSILIVFNERLL